MGVVFMFMFMIGIVPCVDRSTSTPVQLPGKRAPPTSYLTTAIWT
jgi:hypothetical protein